MQFESGFALYNLGKGWELLELGPVCPILHEDGLSYTSYLIARKSGSSVFFPTPIILRM